MRETSGWYCVEGLGVAHYFRRTRQGLRCACGHARLTEPGQRRRWSVAHDIGVLPLCEDCKGHCAA